MSNNKPMSIDSWTLFVFILLTFCQVSLEQNTISAVNVLDHQLNPFKSIDYKQMYHKPINLTIGQQLSIVLPSFDSLYNPNTVSFQYLSDQDYVQTLKRLQSKTQNLDNQNQFSTQQPLNQTQQKQFQSLGTHVLVSQLPLKCNYVPAEAKIYEVIAKITDETGFGRTGFQNKQYIHVTSRQLLYILNNQNMMISVYYYNDINIKYLSSFQLPTNKSPSTSDETSSQSHSSVSMTLNLKQTELYVFSADGIWIIQTKTFLTNIKQASSISALDLTQIGGLDKTLRGGGSYFVALKKMSKVFIIPEITSNERAQFTEITTFYEERIFPQDIAISSSYVFVLDVFNGVYVYRISADNKARQLFKIALTNYAGYQKIHLFQLNTLFVNFNDFDGSKVVEINLDLENQKAELVRYFKNQDYISYIQTYSVLTSSTGFYLNEVMSSDQIDLKHIRNSAQTLLFMISNYQQIQIFPFNIDPRTINMMYNGVKINYPNVKEVHHIFGDRFLVITEESIDYVKISIEKPEIGCLLGKQYNQNYKYEVQNLQITVKSNVSTCEFRNKLLRHKVFYNENCQLTTTYLVHLNDPEKSNLRKIITYGIVLLVVAAFVLGLYCLVQWRNEKLVVLSRLKDEIIRFRNKHRRMQPFVEEQIPQKKQVQMQVPKDIEFIPNEDEQN